jgi:hypothetical protein
VHDTCANPVPVRAQHFAAVDQVGQHHGACAALTRSRVGRG